MLGDQRSAKKIAIDYPPVQACSLDAQNLSVPLKFFICAYKAKLILLDLSGTLKSINLQAKRLEGRGSRNLYTVEPQERRVYRSLTTFGMTANVPQKKAMGFKPIAFFLAALIFFTSRSAFVQYKNLLQIPLQIQQEL